MIEQQCREKVLKKQNSIQNAQRVPLSQTQKQHSLPQNASNNNYPDTMSQNPSQKTLSNKNMRTITSSSQNFSSNKENEEKEELVSRLMEILQDEEVVEILSQVHKSLFPYYEFYADKKGLINFDGFFKFCLDFNLFPDILSKSKTQKIFSSLAGFFQKTNPSKVS